MAKKLWHDKNCEIVTEVNRWNVDLAIWMDDAGVSQLRVYQIRGDITDPTLLSALEAKATEVFATLKNKGE